MIVRFGRRKGLLNVPAFFATIVLLALPGISSALTYTFTVLNALNIPSEFSPWIGFEFQSVTTAGAVVGFCYNPTTRTHHALMWNASSAPIDLAPSGLTECYANGISGGYQVGQGDGHALLWNGTNAAIDLHPSGFTVSVAYGIGGTQQVGHGSSVATGSNHHALLWNGTNAAVDLNPSGITESHAWGTNGARQVGDGWGTATGGSHNPHAMLWNGTNTATDLNPSGFSYSIAYAISDGQEVGMGYADSGGGAHALLWNGTNAAIDLHPPGFTQSIAYGVGGGQQVGFGGAFPNYHALLWNGTNAATDLHALLPGTFLASQAYTLDSAGNVFGLAQDSNYNWHAVEWVVPEPAGLSLLSAAGLSLRTRRGRTAILR